MATNSLTIEQINTVLNSIVSQATGSTAIANYNGNSLITVAQTALLSSPDTVMNAVSQVLSRTIFSIRNYTAKFPTLRADTQRYGNIVRKINFIDWENQQNESYSLADGESVDMYTVQLLNLLQTNFYGQVTWEKQLTTFLTQLDTAFQSASQFGSFWSSLLTHVNNQIEQSHETLARALVVNLIASIISENSTYRVYPLITNYNAETGLELTKGDIYKPENFPAFMAWAASRIARIRRMLTERTSLYHTNVTDKVVMRHTPYENQKMYIYAPVMFDLNMRALTELFNDKYIKLGENQIVSYWQSSQKPDEIAQTPVYMGADGAVKTGTAVTRSDIFGVIFDEDAIGYTVVNERQRTTPLNARGEYFNTFFKYNDRYWMDNSENAIVLTLA